MGRSAYWSNPSLAAFRLVYSVSCNCGSGHDNFGNCILGKVLAVLSWKMHFARYDPNAVIHGGFINHHLEKYFDFSVPDMSVTITIFALVMISLAIFVKHYLNAKKL